MASFSPRAIYKNKNVESLCKTLKLETSINSIASNFLYLVASTSTDLRGLDGVLPVGNTKVGSAFEKAKNSFIIFKEE